MEELKSITEYARQIRLHKNSPSELAEIHIDLAAKYAFISEIFKDLQIEKAQFWQQKFEKEKPLSDTFLEAKWRLTEGGNRKFG